MANRSRVSRPKPRMSGAASDCIVRSIDTGKVLGSFRPKTREDRKFFVAEYKKRNLLGVRDKGLR